MDAKKLMTISCASGETEIVIPLHSEDVSVERRNVQSTVQVRLQTSEHDHLIDEALEQENIVIERVQIGRTIETIPPIRQEGDTTVLSVVEEIVVVERRLVLKEEVRLRRVKTTERHRSTVTLREQHVTVERFAAGDQQPTAQDGVPLPELAPIPTPQTTKD